MSSPQNACLEGDTAHTCIPNPEKSTVDWRAQLKEGRYHLVRFIRRDLKLNVFEGLFLVPPELELEHVIVTINVRDQNLTIFQDGKKLK